MKKHNRKSRVFTIIRFERKNNWNFSLLLLIFLCLYVVWQYASLPETIPNHFRACWGGKASVFIGPGVAIFTCLLMYFVGTKSPGNYNYPVKITEENKTYQYALGQLMIKVINFWCMFLMAYITWGMIQTVKGQTGAMNPIVLWGLIGGLFVVLGWYVWAARKVK